MADKKWIIKCIVCDKKESFDDCKDISYAKWKILSWDVSTGEPTCVCDNCEYPPIDKQEKIKKK